MSGYIGVQPVPQATQTRDVFTATAGQTSFATSGYTPGFLDVYLNGVHLVNGTDYTASNGSDVVLSSGATAGDNLEVVAYTTFEVVDQSFSGNFSVDSPTFVVDAVNNRVGIGTSSPSAPLTVEGSNGELLRLSIVPDGGTQQQFGIGFATGPNTHPAAQINALEFDASDSRADLLFYTRGSNSDVAPTERMRIDSSGDVCIGTTAPAYGEKLIVVNAGVGQNCAYFLFNSTDDRANLILQHQGSSGGTSRKNIQFHNSSAGDVGHISSTGTATSYNTTSDYRLKEDVQPVVGSVDRLMALKPVNFAWKVDGSRVDGFLAHEAQAVVPEAVTGEKDQVETVEIKDEEGNVIGTEERPVYQGIDQSKLVPLLTAALQEALARIETLEAEVAALKGEPA